MQDRLGLLARSRQTGGGPVNTGPDLTIARLRAIVVPSVQNGTASSSTPCGARGVVRSDTRVEVNSHADAAWSHDCTQLRIIARVAAVIPARRGSPDEHELARHPGRIRAPWPYAGGWGSSTSTTEVTGPEQA